MSSDYRPRGGSSSGGSGGGGPRRRRGGRGRGQGGQHGEYRSHSNGSASGGSTPKKEQGPLAKMWGWLIGKKDAPDSRPARTPSSSSRPEYNKERAPRADRPRGEDRPPREDRPRREDRPKSDPVPQEIVSPKLYVGNLAYEAGESDLFDLFSKVGAVKNVEIAMDRHSNRSKGFGFVEMEALETAKEAAAKLNRTEFMGRPIVVSGAKVDKRPSQREPEADLSSHQPDEPSSNPNPESNI